MASSSSAGQGLRLGATSFAKNFALIGAASIPLRKSLHLFLLSSKGYAGVIVLAVALASHQGLYIEGLAAR